MTYPVYRLFISGVCLLLALGMYFVFSRTRLGMMIRAGSTNREMVQSLGMDIKFLYRVVFAAGVAHRGAGRHGGRAGVVGLPGHGQPGADHLLRGGGDRRHRLDPRRAAGGAADRRGRHLRQGAASRAAGVLVYVLMALILLWKPRRACSRPADDR
jgi:branched-chain amino acid transport system permease protein